MLRSTRNDGGVDTGLLRSTRNDGGDYYAGCDPTTQSCMPAVQSCPQTTAVGGFATLFAASAAAAMGVAAAAPVFADDGRDMREAFLISLDWADDLMRDGQRAENARNFHGAAFSYAEAIYEYEHALEVLQGLRRAYAGIPGYEYGPEFEHEIYTRLWHAVSSRIDSLVKCGRIGEAAVMFSGYADLYSAGVLEFEDPELRRDHARKIGELGDIFALRGDHKEAAALYFRAVMMIAGRNSEQPSGFRYTVEAIDSYVWQVGLVEDLATVLRRAIDAEAARGDPQKLTITYHNAMRVLADVAGLYELKYRGDIAAGRIGPGESDYVLDVKPARDPRADMLQKLHGGPRFGANAGANLSGIEVQRFSAALDRYIQSYALFEWAKYRASIGGDGDVRKAAEILETAARHLEESIEIVRTLGDEFKHYSGFAGSLMAGTYKARGLILVGDGQFEAGHRALIDAAKGYSETADIFASTGQIDKAERMAGEVGIILDDMIVELDERKLRLERPQEIGRILNQIVVMSSENAERFGVLKKACLEKGDRRTALTYLLMHAGALEYLGGALFVKGQVLTDTGSHARARDAYDDARRYFYESAVLFQEMNRPSDIRRLTLMGLNALRGGADVIVRAAESDGNLDGFKEAVRRFDLAASLSGDIHLHQDRIESLKSKALTLELMAGQLHRGSMFQDSLKLYREAEAIWRHVEDQRGLGRVTEKVGDVLSVRAYSAVVRGDMQEADQFFTLMDIALNNAARAYSQADWKDPNDGRRAVSEVSFDHARHLVTWGDILSDSLRQPAEAEELYEKARDLFAEAERSAGDLGDKKFMRRVKRAARGVEKHGEVSAARRRPGIGALRKLAVLVETTPEDTRSLALDAFVAAYAKATGQTIEAAGYNLRLAETGSSTHDDLRERLGLRPAAITAIVETARGRNAFDPRTGRREGRKGLGLK